MNFRLLRQNNFAFPKILAGGLEKNAFAQLVHSECKLARQIFTGQEQT